MGNGGRGWRNEGMGEGGGGGIDTLLVIKFERDYK